VIDAALTLTMGLPKTCLYLPRARLHCGRILVVPVGFPPQLVEDPGLKGEMISARTWSGLMAPVAADVHKNSRGHLAVFAGAPGTTGAAWLCASAAARCRVGLVTLHAAADAYPVLAAKMTSIMCRPWDPARDGSTWDPTPFSAFLAGPGWGVTPQNGAWLRRLLEMSTPGVLDADALSLLATVLQESPRVLSGRWVLTPHPGEFSRMTGIDRAEVMNDPLRHARDSASRYQAVVVLKGPCTVIAAPDGRHWILDGVNPALATGGSGDVLAGIIAAGIATGMDPVDAALFGVSLHSHVGREAARKRGWFLAEDLVPLLSPALGR